MAGGVTDQAAAAYLVHAALLDVRGSAFRRELLTVGVPAVETDVGDFLLHLCAVADLTVDLPAWIADPGRRFNGYTLGEWLAHLAEGDGPRARWVRAVYSDIGYVPRRPVASGPGGLRCGAG